MLKFYIDESGNTGDLVHKKSNNFNLNFNNQPFFALAAVGLLDRHIIELHEIISKLKKEYKIQSPELKAENIFDKKSQLILKLVNYLLNNEINYFIELTDKKYFICNNIVHHQVFPSYFIPIEQELMGYNQIIREIFIDFFVNDLTEKEYSAFFSACIEASEEKLKLSFSQLSNFAKNQVKGTRDLYRKQVYQSICERIDLSIEYFNDFKKREKDIDLIVRKFIPIPDKTKRGNLVHLLPQIPSLTNIIARINKLENGIKNIHFIHDEQKQFDLISIDNIQEMVGLNIPNFNFTQANFHLKEKPSINFEVNSKESIGIQIADILAGFTMRYIDKKLHNQQLDNIHHEIFEKIEYGCKKYSPINYVMPISGFVKLNKPYERGIKISDEAKCAELYHHQYLLSKYLRENNSLYFSGSLKPQN